MFAQYNGRVDTPEQIALFLRRVDELRRRRLVQQGGGLGFTMNISRETEGPPNISLQIRLPDEEDVRSFLLVFRQLAMMKDSPVLVTKVYTDCFKALESDSELRDRLIGWRRAWKQTQREFTVGIRFGDYAIPPEALADLWINGYYFHSDAKKYEQLESMFGGSFMPAKVTFINYLVNASRGIDHLGHLVAEGIDNEVFNF